MWLKMITVINLKIGNIASVSRALRYLKIHHTVSSEPDVISKAEKLILPGVGNFFAASARLDAFGLRDILKSRVLEDRVPILGICLGMQLFATWGEEGGGCAGLNFIRGNVVYHRAKQQGLRLPHIGWNDVDEEDFKVFESIPDKACFYFVHSYEMVPEEPVKAAYSEYGVDFIAALQKEHIIGVQFHPEKSQEAGLRLLDNFCKGRF